MTAEMSVATDPEVPEQESSKELSSLKQLNLMAEGVIFNLLDEFCQEYQAFATKSTLKKKKKSTLPGLRSS